MIRIFIYFIFLITLSGQIFAVSTVNWLDLVRQKTVLEQDKNTPDGFIAQNSYENKKEALEDALDFYHEKFDGFYNDIMSVIDPCNEWCDLKDFLVINKKELDSEYIKIKRKDNQILRQFEMERSGANLYQTAIEAYYNKILGIMKDVTVEGQNKQVQLFKKALAEKQQEKIQEKRIEQGNILVTDESGE